MKSLRCLSYTSACNISRSVQLFKKAPRLTKNKPKGKISLSPKFFDNIKQWPKLLEEEKKAQFEKLNELIAAKTNWLTIEERGLCAGNLTLKTKFNDVANGVVAVFSGENQTRMKWLRTGTPISVNRLDSEGQLKFVTDGHVVDFSAGVRVCVYESGGLEYSISNYILMPSSNSGSIKYLQTILKNPETLSSDSAHLVNLAYRSVIMPSIHDSKVRNLPESLNESQAAAVSAALNTQRNLLCIQGPPGTGKTRVIAEIVHQLISRRKKVIVCAPTHVAVRNALEATARRMEEEIDREQVYSRLWTLNSNKDEFQNHKNAPKLAEMIRQMMIIEKGTPSYNSLAKQCYSLRISIMKDLLAPRRAIFTTLGTSSIQRLPEYKWNADVMLIDEAAQCTEPATWVPVLTTPKCKKLVLVGDQKQLPAVVLSDKAVQNNLKVSLMEKLADEFADSNINILLKEQYRMNRKIMRWSNEVFYDDQLTANPSVAEITLNDICPSVPADHVLNNPILFINMDGMKARTGELMENNSFANIDETSVVTEYVNRLVIDAGVDEKQIAVIAPYYAQIEQLRNSIRFRVDVNTVDAFQGHERQVVIFCLVRDNDDGSIGFLRETRRLNVAITRAKRQFVLVGSGKMMKRNKHLKRLYEHFKAEKVIFDTGILKSFDDLGNSQATEQVYR